MPLLGLDSRLASGLFLSWPDSTGPLDCSLDCPRETGTIVEYFARCPYRYKIILGSSRCSLCLFVWCVCWCCHITLQLIDPIKVVRDCWHRDNDARNTNYDLLKPSIVLMSLALLNLIRKFGWFWSVHVASCWFDCLTLDQNITRLELYCKQFKCFLVNSFGFPFDILNNFIANWTAAIHGFAHNSKSTRCISPHIRYLKPIFWLKLSMAIAADHSSFVPRLGCLSDVWSGHSH